MTEACGCGARSALDIATRRWLQAESFCITERSTDISREQRTLLTEVNAIRLVGDIPPLPAPDHWLAEASECDLGDPAYHPRGSR
jgi:hypothetical protein